MLRRKRAVFAPTDGVLSVMDELAWRRDRGVDFSDVAGLIERFKLDFRSSRLRTEDLELAGRDGIQLTRKVTCRRAPGVDAGTVVAIAGFAYDVERVDLSARTMTLLLSELQTDGKALLLSTTSTRDARGETTRSKEGTEVWVRKSARGTEARESAHVDGTWPTEEITIRACDYDGETRVRRRGREFSVVRTRGRGTWVTLECEGGVANGKRHL